MIIGSGSASFEILRYLVERLPDHGHPEMGRAPSASPIAIRDVLYCLVAVLELPETAGRTFDIGGSDVLTYREIMQTMAEALGLAAPDHRARSGADPAPELALDPPGHPDQRQDRPPARGGPAQPRRLPRRHAPAAHRPHFMSVRESIEAAVTSWRERRVPTAWSDAGVMPGDPDWAGGTTYTDSRSIEVEAPAEATFRAVPVSGGRRLLRG